eukprot:scaffold131043_cov19-Tisochrysis_lutea.AAC.1
MKSQEHFMSEKWYAAGLNGEQLTDTLVGVFLKGVSRNDEVFNTPEPLVRLRGIHSRLARCACALVMLIHGVILR